MWGEKMYLACIVDYVEASCDTFVAGSSFTTPIGKSVITTAPLSSINNAEVRQGGSRLSTSE